MSAGLAMVDTIRPPVPGLAALRERAAPLTGALRLETDPADRDGWIGRDMLTDPETGPFAELHARFVTGGFACNKRAAAASLLLRYGWAAGFQIASWLDSGHVVRLDQFAIKFSASTLVEGVWIERACIDIATGEQAGLAALLASLKDFTGPLVESQHRWSRFSRHALWSMAVSSWAAQFTAIGQRLGRREEAMDMARAMFARDPEIARAAPQTYVVGEGERARGCQVRAACCLYYKGPARHFCVSCPIIPQEERLARNREWCS